jgi:WD40 repeat protein
LIREWDTSTWGQIGDSWAGHTSYIFAIAVNSTGTLVASASDNGNVRLWRRSDKQTIAIFKHSAGLLCVAFSTDGKYIFSGGRDNRISQWAIPEDALLQDTAEVGFCSFQCCRHGLISPKDKVPDNYSSEEQATSKVTLCCFSANNYSNWCFM